MGVFYGGFRSLRLRAPLPSWAAEKKRPRSRSTNASSLRVSSRALSSRRILFGAGLTQPSSRKAPRPGHPHDGRGEHRAASSRRLRRCHRQFARRAWAGKRRHSQTSSQRSCSNSRRCSWSIRELSRGSMPARSQMSMACSTVRIKPRSRVQLVPTRSPPAGGAGSRLLRPLRAAAFPRERPQAPRPSTGTSSRCLRSARFAGARLGREHP